MVTSLVTSSMTSHFREVEIETGTNKTLILYLTGTFESLAGT